MVAHVHDAAAYCSRVTGRPTAVLVTDDPAAIARVPDGPPVDVDQLYMGWFPVMWQANAQREIKAVTAADVFSSVQTGAGEVIGS